MKKFPLHWQILIALVLAIVVGILFPTKYKITEKTVLKLRNINVPVDVTEQLKTLEGQVYNTRLDFVNHLKSLPDYSKIKPYQAKIFKHAYLNKEIEYVSWMGDLFLRALKMLILPLILSSIISAVTNIGTGEKLGRLGLKTITYYVSTSTLAIVTGLFLVNLVKPGVGADRFFAQEVEGMLVTENSLGQTLMAIVPTNIFEALASSQMLSVIFFSILFGFFITQIKKSSQELMQNFFHSVFEVMMKITLFIIRFTPLGVFGIVVKIIADQDDLVELAQRMGLYMSVVLAGLFIHAFFTLPMLTRYLGKASPFKHFGNMTSPLLTAFSTSSSGATLPLTLSAVQRRSGVSFKISNFTLPLGATINMDGTALYECVAAMFIAQAYGIDLSIGQQIIIVVTALLASIGAAAIPMAGLVMITVILSAVGLPLEGVGLILSVDRLLDMFRTATNVWSDTCGAVIIAKSEGEHLPVDVKPSPPIEN